MTEFPRDLTHTELGVLNLLLSVEFPGVNEYRKHLADARVTWRCSCGCLEFTVEVAPDSQPVDDGGVLVSAWSERQQVHVHLETPGGLLGGVGLMWFGDDAYRIDPDLSTFAVEAEQYPPA